MTSNSAIEVDRELFHQMMRGLKTATEGLFVESNNMMGGETFSVEGLEPSAQTERIADTAHRLANLTAAQTGGTVRLLLDAVA